MKSAKILLLLCVFIFLQASFALAEDIVFDATVDANKVSLGDSFNLSLTFYGASDAPRPELSGIDGFDARYLGPSTQISIVNGRTSSSVTYLYSLLPKKEGIFTIPPLTVTYKGSAYTSKPITVEVLKGPVPPAAASQIAQSAGVVPDSSDRIFAAIEPGKRIAYQNELIPIKIRLYINNLAVRDIQYPSFQGNTFSIGNFETPRQYRETLNGVIYDIIEFDTLISANTIGTSTLGPACIKCNLITQSRNKQRSMFDEDFFGSDIFGDFFNRYQAHPFDLNSEEVSITILALPENGKPADFNGAIGQYDFQLNASPKELKVGDPITLYMAISGRGNFKTLSEPDLKMGDNFKVYDPETKQEAFTKTFTQVVIPKSDNIKEIHAISFSFFNPETERYQTVTRGPIPIKVSPLPKEEALRVYGKTPQAKIEDAKEKEILGRDIIYIKDFPGNLRLVCGPICARMWFAGIQAASVIFLIIIFFYEKRKTRIASDIRYARRLRASSKARRNLAALEKLLDGEKSPQFFDEAFKALREYIGDKFHLPSAGITVSVVDDILGKKGVKPEVLDRIRILFSECDMARYVPSKVTPEDMKAVYNLLTSVIDSLEKVRL